MLAWFIETARTKGKEMSAILEELTERIVGTFAIAIMIKGENNIYVAKRDSPLIIGLGEDQLLITSDGCVFDDSIEKVVYLEDDEYGVVDAGKYALYSKGNAVQKEEQDNEYHNPDNPLGEFTHYLHKEISQTPIVAKTLMDSLANEQKERFEQIQKIIYSNRPVLFVACGTASYAAGLGAQALRAQGVKAKTIIASEYEENFVDTNTVVVAISQSGETMDVIEIIKSAKAKNATIIGITNTALCTIERLSDHCLRICAGVEVAVASSKAFTNQALTLFALAKADVQSIPQDLKKTAQLEPTIKQVAKQFLENKDLQSMYILGRKRSYDVAKEAALKIKEVSYIHAEAMRAGEFKHGSLALIEEGSEVLGIFYEDDKRMHASLEEARTRGANITKIGTTESSTIRIQAANEDSFLLCAGMCVQFLGYYLGLLKGFDVDRPRNLAKSVTVH